MPKIIAHRGGSHDAPENTLAAFSLAWVRQADGFECDIRKTGDGEIVCLHDADTGRVGNGGGRKGRGVPVGTSTLAQLQAVDVGRWKGDAFAGQVPPSLGEALQLVEPGKQVFIEIKGRRGAGVAAMPGVLAALDASGLDPSQASILSFDTDVVRLAKQRRPEFTVNWLTRFKRVFGVGPWKPGIDKVVATLRATGADGLGCKPTLQHVNETFVARLREHGFGFHLWTVNDPDIARRAIALGVDSLTTDRPGFLREALLRGEPRPTRENQAGASPQ
ncbi:MAG: glycerophosphodiester phosphodiesterase family protein [Planctomycetota bacterium]